MKAFRGIISKVKLGKIPFIISERKSTGKTHVPDRTRRYQVARIGKSSVIHGINKHNRNIIFFCKQSLVGHRRDRKSVVEGKTVSVSEDLDGCGVLQKKNNSNKT